MKILIRADGNKEIAMGHIMRCLSIADALRAQGDEAAFVTAGNETSELILRRGFENFVLATDFRDMEAELPILEKTVKRYKPDLILIDSYFVTVNYLTVLKSWCLTTYLDDMGRPVYPVNMLINYNIYGDTLPYGKWYAESDITLPWKMLLGCEYVPLRKEFFEEIGKKGPESKAGGQCRNVLISTGGGDKAQVAGKLCRRILKEMEQGLHKNISYHVICGPFSEDKEWLTALSKEHEAFTIHKNVTCMSELMKSCDAAISAAGSTMYELCSMKLPAICFYFAENQRRMAECFGRSSGIVNAGNVIEEEDAVLSRILNRLGELEGDAGLRSEIAGQMGRLVDGRGALRIAKGMTELYEEKGSKF